MKKGIIFFVIFSLVIISCFSKSNDYDFKKMLLGTWSAKIDKNPIAKVYVPNVSIVFYDIDKTQNTQKIIVSADANAPFEILSYKKMSDNIYKCQVTEDDINIYEIQITFLKENGIKISNGRMFFFSDIYYKISRFDLSESYKFIPSVNKLSFREKPTLNAKRIRMLTLDDKVEILETDKSEVINGVKGTWVKVRTEKGEEGWCFDAYLEEYRE